MGLNTRERGEAPHRIAAPACAGRLAYIDLVSTNSESVT
jgi:hypothetical protein